MNLILTMLIANAVIMLILVILLFSLGRRRPSKFEDINDDIQSIKKSIDLS